MWKENNMWIDKIAQDELSRCEAIALERYDFSISPVVKWNIKSLRCYGTALTKLSGECTIRLNPQIAEILGNKYKQTVGHEFVHCLVQLLIDRKDNTPDLLGDKKGGHGRGWKNMMKIFGLIPSRTVPDETSSIVHSQITDLGIVVSARLSYNYFCPYCKNEYKLGKVRHNNMLKGIRTYSCRKCHVRLIKK
jgi:predicted SprT family Zn-dependent metalloprotease